MSQEALDLGPQKVVTLLGHRYTGESKGDYFYSLNGEDYQGEGQPTREGAIAEARYEMDECGEDEENFGVWTGRGVKRTLAALADGESKWSQLVDGIVERAKENAYEWVGEHAENFLSDARVGPGATPEQLVEWEELRYVLMIAIDQWADRHGHQPRFFGVEDTEGP